MRKLITTTILLASATAFADGEAKNIIFFLGDGMGPATVTAARLFKGRNPATGKGGGDPTARLTMQTLPRSARVRTYSEDAQTTDSAPSMGSYMTGYKMKNQVDAMTPDTDPTLACSK